MKSKRGRPASLHIVLSEEVGAEITAKVIALFNELTGRRVFVHVPVPVPPEEAPHRTRVGRSKKQDAFRVIGQCSE